MRNIIAFALVLTGCSSSLNAFSDKTPVVDGFDTGAPTGDDDDDDDDDDDGGDADTDADADTDSDADADADSDADADADTDTDADSDTDTDTDTDPNTPPDCVAEANPAVVMVLDRVILDGTGSSDADGDPLSFQWTFVTRPNGSGTNMIGSQTDTAEFFPDRAGTYEIELEVDDGTDVRACSVFVDADTPNQDPVADAGNDQRVTVGDFVQLDGSFSSDPDNDPLTYEWQMTRVPNNSTATLNNAQTRTPSFTADRRGDYEIELRVNDGTVWSASSVVRVTAEEDDPTTGGTTSCFGCAAAEQELDRRLRVGDAAGSIALVLLPIFVLLAQRRRD